jgi:ribosomal protein S18 acetylase RimI-like enzyme
MSDVVVRVYRRRDRDAVLRITEESFGDFCLDANMERHFGRIAETTWQQRKREGIEYDLRRNHDHAFVAELGGEVVGYACTRVYREHSTGHVANMAVALGHQNQGIGKLLLQACLDHFRDCGMRYARIETLEQNRRGQHLYPSFGFREIGRQIFYFREL